MRSFWLALGLIVACSGGEDERHPAAPAQGGTGSAAGSGPRAGSASKPDAGQAGEADAPGGANGEGGAAGEPPIIYEMGGLPQNTPGVCHPLLELGEPEAQDVGVDGATLLAMSSDELSVVFSTGADGSFALQVGDRDSVDAAFAQLTVTLPTGYLASQGVALSADGRKLVIVRDDGSGFAELSRSARGAAFGVEPDETRFAKINALKPMSGESVGWPVLSADGRALYFVSHFGQARVKQSGLEADVFNIGKPIDEFTLGGEAGKYKLLSGISEDQRAIFFFDQATSRATALFRSYPDAPFYEPLDLGERRGAAPNKDCSRIYSSVASGIVFQTTQ
jgi:hypothetical protein